MSSSPARSIIPSGHAKKALTGEPKFVKPCGKYRLRPGNQCGECARGQMSLKGSLGREEEDTEGVRNENSR